MWKCYSSHRILLTYDTVAVLPRQAKLAVSECPRTCRWRIHKSATEGGTFWVLEPSELGMHGKLQTTSVNVRRSLFYSFHSLHAGYRYWVNFFHCLGKFLTLVLRTMQCGVNFRKAMFGAVLTNVRHGVNATGRERHPRLSRRDPAGYLICRTGSSNAPNEPFACMFLEL